MNKQGDIPNNVTLEIIEGAEEGSVFTIDKKTLTIGREKSCNIQLSDEHVSNKHCQVAEYFP